MVETVAVVLLRWPSEVSSHAVGGFIHVLLVAAVVVILVRVIQGSLKWKRENSRQSC